MNDKLTTENLRGDIFLERIWTVHPKSLGFVMPSLLREAKYKKTVEAVYGEAGPNAHNIQSLQQYALMTPGKLPKIGKYVLNKAKEGLKEKKKGVR